MSLVLTLSETVSIWDKTLKKLSSSMDAATMQAFFAESYIHSVNGNEIFVVVPNELAARVIEAKYAAQIRETIYELTQNSFIISYITGDKAKTITQSVNEGEKQFFSDSKIDPRYTLENFFVGPSNREAYQAAVIASREPGKMYNPVLIYGDSGLGKTHLLHAIGNAILKENSNLNGYTNTKFVVSDVFDYLINAEKNNEKFDVVILDPPAFTKSKNSVKNASKGYKEINYRAMKILNNGGILVTCSCSEYMPKDLFLKIILINVYVIK